MKHEKRKQWIEEAFQSLMGDFGLLPCEVVFRDGKDTSEGIYARAMGIHYNYPYPQLEIVIFPLAYKMTLKELQRTVLHEALHLALWELKHFRGESQKVWEDLEEKVVERLAIYFAPKLQ